MLKNIFIHIGDDAGTHSLKQFWKTHKQYLDKNGFWHPDYEEILPPLSQQMSLQAQHDVWLFEMWQQSYGLPPTEEILARIDKALLSKPHIHTLLFSFHDLPASQYAKYFAVISFLRQIFSESTLHVLWQQFPLDVTVELDIHAWVMAGLTLPVTFTSFTMQCALQANKYPQPDDIRSQFTTAWGKNVSIDFTQCNTGDALLQWQQWLNLPQPYPQINPIRTILSPKVFAYIKAAQPSVAWEKFGTNEFLQCKQPYNWLAQEKFLAFEHHIPTARQYFRDSFKKELRAHYNKNAHAPWLLQDEEIQATLSEAPITLSAEEAQMLSSLLTPDFCKLLLQGIDQNNLQYASQDKRNVFGSLLLKEKILDEDAFKKITAYPQGVCLPISSTNTGKICDIPPTVAVLTVAYNQREFIEENILCVMMQETTFPVTHIIVDNASTDGTQEILKEYAARYPHIHLIINETNDIECSIRSLFNQAKAPYVALCDGDDYFTDPLKLQKQVDLLEANPSYSLCFHPVTMLDAKDLAAACVQSFEALPGGIQPYYTFADSVRSDFIQANSVMYRWRFQEGLPQWFDPSLSARYWHLLHAECGNIGFQNDSMTVYRQHKNTQRYQDTSGILKHRNKYGYQKMELYKHCHFFDLQFDEKMTPFLPKPGLNVFLELVLDVVRTTNTANFNYFIETFPDFEQYVRTVNPKAIIPTVKNISILISSASPANAIKQFYTQHTDYFDKNGFWHPCYEEILQSDMQNTSSLIYIQDEWITDENLILINKKLLDKPHIHTLLFFFDEPNGVEDDKVFDSIPLIKKYFNETALNIFWQQTPFDIILQHEINMCAVFGRDNTYFSRLHSFLKMNEPLDLHEINSKMHALWGEDARIHLALCKIEETLFQWQQWLGLPQPYPHIQINDVMFSPKILAFIRAVQPKLEWHKFGTREFLQCKQPYNWLNEKKFLDFENDFSTNTQYLKKYWRGKLRTCYNETIYPSLSCPEKELQAEFSETPIALSALDAQTLASLLTPDFRKLIVQDIYQATLQYKSQNERNSFGAILLAEKVIDENTFRKLTPLPKGACLPISQTSIIEVCEASPTVAVLTMTYNQREFIEENILSVMAQKTTFPVTHIIADDASTDGTQEILKEYAARYPHIHLIINETNDTPSSIIRLFNQTKTPYVALCDGDDYFTDPLKLQNQVDLLEANPSYGLCFHPVAILYTEDPTIMRIYPPLNELPRGIQKHYYLLELVCTNFIQTNSVMYRWRFQDGLPLWFNPYLCPGDRYWHLLHAECGKIGFQNSIMSVYRRHPKSLFFQTESDSTGHRKKRGVQEMQLYEHLDLHFEGRFTKQLHKLGLNIFEELAHDAAKRKDATYLFDFAETFPIFKQYITKVKKIL